MIQHVTRYRGITLTPYICGQRDKNGNHRPGGYGYTKRSRRVFDFIGDCIAGGGRVEMETWYDSLGRVRADIRLEWAS